MQELLWRRTLVLQLIIRTFRCIFIVQSILHSIIHLQAPLMKKEEIPQDDGALSKSTKEVCYAVDSEGKYTTELSTGWEVKSTALDAAWADIETRVENAKQQVIKGEASPL